MIHVRLPVIVLAAIGSMAAAPVFAEGQHGACRSGEPMRIRGDVPGAISFDVFRQLQPTDPQTLALFQSAGSVRLLKDGTPVCEIADDGVDDPRAVLVRSERGQMAWWVDASSVLTTE